MSRLRIIVQKITFRLRRKSVPLHKYEAVLKENTMLKTDIMELALNYNKLLDYVEKKEAKDDQLQKLLVQINKKMKILENPKYLPRLSRKHKDDLEDAEREIDRLIFSKTRKKVEGFDRIDITKYRT